MKPVLGDIGDPGEDVGEPRLGIDVVHLGGDDQAVHEGGSLAATVRTGEQPRLSAKGNTAQGALGGIVAEAKPAIVEEAGEAGPPLEHVIDRLGDRGVTGQAGAFGAHPRLQVGNQRGALFRPHGQSLVGWQSVDGAFDLEEGVDPRHRLQRHVRDRRRVFAAPGIGGDVGQFEELLPCVAPTQAVEYGGGRAAGLIETIVSGVGVGLQQAGEAGQMSRSGCSPARSRE